ncbi:glycosyltransferase family 2 protein [Thermosynechococcus sp. B3]|uniref:glycosyltransferase family 2 protein n=1 Tax=unclassified Thermosynechococcus TaxID=2622553 RepID=UPI002575EB14|nr:MULTISPECIES: glycosyltransferase family 2 protein [unclassified Thermosynechococcus]WJI26710.1 glycosyltransferase family 2 protein [Thermosynechococcus sp. B1]WJI29238.1 glycosyltransferase family 2 protein [Thermosynechococcus sp. B3]
MVRVCACLIVKNEAAHLARCLGSVQPWVDEIVVVDTGSTDETIAIARQFTERIFTFPWQDDFAAARNYSLEQATGDWILVIDADEVLVSLQEPPVPLGQQLEGSTLTAYQLLRREIGTGQQFSDFAIVRLFRNLPTLRYQGRFHEQLVSTAAEPLTIGTLETLRIDHYGYQPAQIQAKMRDRNIPILERIRASEGLPLNLLFALAEMYHAVNNPTAADDCYQELFERLLPHLLISQLPENAPGALPEILNQLGRRLLAMGDHETLQLLCQQSLVWFPTYPPLNDLAGRWLMALGFPLGATAYFEYCLELGRTNGYSKQMIFPLGYVREIAAEQLGRAYETLGDRERAAAAFAQATAFRQERGNHQ